MDRDSALKKEIGLILASPQFERSKSLSGLLTYLLRAHLTFDRSPTQADIAVDFLGKNLCDFDPGDSSVRVAMMRLRKALKEYYLVHKPHDTLYVHFNKGEYRLRFSALSIAYPDLANFSDKTTGSRQASFVSETVKDGASNSVLSSQFSQSEPADSERPQPKHVSEVTQLQKANHGLPSQPRVMILAVGILSILMVFLLGLFKSPDPATAEMPRRATLQPPLVSLRTEVLKTELDNREANSLRKRIETETKSILRKSMISRLSEGNISRANYHLAISVEASPDGLLSGNLVVTGLGGKVLTERTFRALDGYLPFSQSVNDELTGIIAPSGHIAKDLLQGLDAEPTNSYECFLLAEAGRIAGNAVSALLKNCVKAYPDGEFTPFLKVRDAFIEAQRFVLRGQKLSTQTSAWQTVSEVLKTDPENPYANALAAKLLIGSGRCMDAAAFATEAFSRGRTYPTLELSVIVDAFGCHDVAQFRPFWRERIRRIAIANPDPDPLLQSYLTMGLIISDQTALSRLRKSRIFDHVTSGRPANMNQTLDALMNDHNNVVARKKLSADLPKYIFSRSTREMIKNKFS